MPSHPSLAHIYTSRKLNELIKQSLQKICEEQAHTVKLKHLLKQLLGDDPWINMEKMHWPNEDHEALARDRSENLLRQFADLQNGGGVISQVAETNGKLTNGTPKPAENGVEEDAEDHNAEMAGINGHADHTAPERASAAPGGAEEVEDDAAHPPPATQDTVMEDDDPTQPKTEDAGEDDHDATPPPEPRRMTTRSALNNATSPAPPSEAPSVEVDPWFFPPNYSVDRDYGIPPPEAEETRRLVSAAVQRQDEFLRGLLRVQDGLLRAESMRKKVWDWCRTMEGMREYHQHIAEVSGHPHTTNYNIDEGDGVGLSDGEDWYDMDAWKLDEPLEKGREEEDDAEIIPHGKKTRRRGDR